MQNLEISENEVDSLKSVTAESIPGSRTDFGENPFQHQQRESGLILPLGVSAAIVSLGEIVSDPDLEDTHPVPSKDLGSIWNKSVSRRTAGRIGAAAGISLIFGKNLWTPRSARAVDANLALDGSGEDGSVWPPEERYKFVKDIDTATLNVDSRLSTGTRITHISGLGYNSYPEEFKDIQKNPKDPRNMLDYAAVKVFAGLWQDIDVITSFENRPYEGAELFDNVYAKRQQNNFELPPRGKVSEYVKLLKEGGGKPWVWAVDENAQSGLGETLTEVDPAKGIDVFIMADEPHSHISTRANGKASSGFTITVIDGKMRVGIYISDRDYKSDYYSDGKNADIGHSLTAYGALERIMMWAGRNDLMRPLDATYLSKRQSVNFGLYPDIASLMLGPLSKDGYYDASPVLQVMSPEIYRDIR